MSTVSQPDPVGGTMQVDTGEFAALRDEVAELRELLAKYHDEACVIRALEDVLDHPMTTASYRASASQGGTGRPRHLRSVGDDAS